MKRTMLYLSLLAVSCSVSAAKYTVLTESSPEKAGFNVERLNQMDRWISQQVDAGYPGVNLLIIKDNQIVGNDSNLLIVFYVQIMPDDLVMQLHRF